MPVLSRKENPTYVKKSPTKDKPEIKNNTDSAREKSVTDEERTKNILTITIISIPTIRKK